VSCGTLGTEPIATELWAFPSGTTIATGTADTRAADTTVTPSAAGTVARPRFTG
jgi:hypothetical protein